MANLDCVGVFFKECHCPNSNPSVTLKAWLLNPKVYVRRLKFGELSANPPEKKVKSKKGYSNFLELETSNVSTSHFVRVISMCFNVICMVCCYATLIVFFCCLCARQGRSDQRKWNNHVKSACYRL